MSAKRDIKCQTKSCKTWKNHLKNRSPFYRIGSQHCVYFFIPGHNDLTYRLDHSSFHIYNPAKYHNRLTHFDDRTCKNIVCGYRLAYLDSIFRVHQIR